MRLTRGEAVRHRDMCLHESAHASAAPEAGRHVKFSRVQPHGDGTFIGGDLGRADARIIVAGRVAQEMRGLDGIPALERRKVCTVSAGTISRSCILDDESNRGPAETRAEGRGRSSACRLPRRGPVAGGQACDAEVESARQTNYVPRY
jgi:hypothetical protein